MRRGGAASKAWMAALAAMTWRGWEIREEDVDAGIRRHDDGGLRDGGAATRRKQKFFASFFQKSSAFFLLPLLTGCGFTPLYGDGGAVGSSVSAQLEQVRVETIVDRTGQMLHDTLQDDMQREGAPATQLYSLNVTYEIDQDSIGIQSDTSSTRTRFVATADWTLSPIGDPGTTLAKGHASTEDAENIIDNQYFDTELEENTVNQQLADQIAGQITGQVAVYFKTHS
jgi:LPS-assembly lipoprotein